MATYTSNYGWTKPSGSDNVDISVLNDNLDDQDSTIHDAFLNMAPPFSESATYAVDDIVLYGTGLYKCHTAVVTPGSWTGSTNWQVYKLSEGGSGGGGTSNYNQLSNKPQINSVELSGNKTAAQLGLMASDGVVANPTGQTTGSLTALEVGGTKYAVGGGSGTSDYTDLINKPSINGVTLTGNKTTSDLGIDKTAVGLGNVPNVSTNDQTPTFTEASTRNNIASGEKLSVILGKVQKFFNDLKTVAFTGSYNDLTNKPTIPTSAGGITYDNTTSGLTATNVQGAVDELRQADNIMMSDGVTSVEEAVDDINSSVSKKLKSGYNTSSQLGAWWVAAGNMSGEVTYSVAIPDDAIYIAVKVTIVDTMAETFYVPADLIKAFSSDAYYPLNIGTYNPNSAFYAIIGLKLFSNKAALSHQSYGTNSQSKEKSIQLFYLYN